MIIFVTFCQRNYKLKQTSHLHPFKLVRFSNFRILSCCTKCDEPSFHSLPVKCNGKQMLCKSLAIKIKF